MTPAPEQKNLESRLLTDAELRPVGSPYPDEARKRCSAKAFALSEFVKDRSVDMVLVYRQAPGS